MTAKNGLVIALAISALYVAALAYPVHRHVVGVFSDFYVRFAPDADRIAAGEFPRNTYNPPGYPALLVLASPLAPDHFTTGKWMSLLAGGLTGVLAFLLFRRLFGVGAGVLAVPIVLSSAAFATYAITAMTDVPFVCLCVLAMLAITSESPHRLRSIAVSGALCGAAYLMRYNALFLLVPGVAAAVWGPGDWPSRARRGALFLASVLITISPWLWASYAHWGAPFYSTNYEDVARAFGISRPGGFRSLSDVVLEDPARFVRRYVSNIAPILYRTVGAGLALLPVGPLAVAGIALALLRHRRKPVLLVLLAALAFLLLMTLTHWEKRYFFFILVCYAGFAALAIVEIAGWIDARFHAPRAARLAMALLMLWILAPSAVTVSRAAAKTLSRQPLELLPAARAVALDAPPQATVMSVRAQMAYLSGRAWRPLPGAESIDDLKVKIQDRPPGYIAYDRWARKYVPQLKSLADPGASPPWLVPVYSHPSITVYRVELARSADREREASTSAAGGRR